MGRREAPDHPAHCDGRGVRDGYAFAGCNLVPGTVREDDADAGASPFDEFGAVEGGRVRIVRCRLRAEDVWLANLLLGDRDELLRWCCHPSHRPPFGPSASASRLFAAPRRHV